MEMIVVSLKNFGIDQLEDSKSLIFPCISIPSTLTSNRIKINSLNFVNDSLKSLGIGIQVIAFTIGGVPGCLA
jgi:hypothetical protein